MRHQRSVERERELLSDVADIIRLRIAELDMEIATNSIITLERPPDLQELTDELDAEVVILAAHAQALMKEQGLTH